ncbi:MAG: PEGA domain-containing protein [Acidobacteria bacterium]|nr:PEGA domain-containing protein [Acidobacteriota bacterium]MBI3427211.1 PEGA domain-containing protein [Acidobacteriota bacterium]
MLAQRDYTVVRPRERAATEKVTLNRRATQATKGILAVVLQPVLAAKVVVTDAKGNIIEQTNTDNVKGQAEFELRRGASFTVKVTAPGYLAAETKAKVLKSTNIVPLSLIAQFARIELPGAPVGAEIFIDGKARALADQSGRVIIDTLEPGDHTLSVRHPEYNDYVTRLEKLEAGTSINLPLNTLLTKVAKLTIQSQPNATVLIDGEFQGRVNANGQVQIDYQLAQAAEHTIAVELPGYHPWSRKEMLTPGPRKLEIKLDPIVTSAGITDGFANLAQWNAPATWKIASEKNKELDTNKLQVSGATPGILKEKTYRDFDVSFTVWLKDGKGASWVVRADKTGRSYYLFHLSGPQAGELRPRRLYTYRVRDGVTSEVETPIPLTIEFKENDSYYITVKVRGNQIQHKLAVTSTADEDKSGASYTDTSNDKDLFLYGSFGFVSFKGEVFLVDDLLLDPVKE